MYTRARVSQYCIVAIIWLADTSETFCITWNTYNSNEYGEENVPRRRNGNRENREKYRSSLEHPFVYD